jgi:glutamate/aspartate transport system substrate-binding protein
MTLLRLVIQPELKAATMKCVNCQAELDPKNLFCSECGHPVERVEVDAPTTSAAPPSGVQKPPTLAAQPATAASDPPTPPYQKPPQLPPQPPPAIQPAIPPQSPQPTQDEASSRTLPLGWIVSGCLGGIILVLIAGLAASYFGWISIPGRAQVQPPTALPVSTPLTAAGADPTELPAEAAATDLPANPPTTAPTATSMPLVLDLQSSPKAVEILERGFIRVGVSEGGLPPFSIRTGESYTGFEITLIANVVNNLFDDQVNIQLIPQGAGERFSSIQAGETDLVVQTLVHTFERESLGAVFTQNYFLDGPRLLVRSDDPPAQLSDMDGKAIAVKEWRQDEFESETLALGWDIEFIPVDSLQDGAALLANGQVFGVLDYWLELIIFTGENPGYRADGMLLNFWPMGMIVPANEPEFRDLIDATLDGMIADGSYFTIFENWFGAMPYSVDLLLGAPPIQQ